MSNAKELRDFISHDIYRELDHLNSNWGVYIDGINRAKNWCITLFMVSIGFVLTKKCEIDKSIFFILPLIPVVWFWIYTAYQRYCADVTSQKKTDERWLDILYDLHLFSEEVLKQKIEEIKKIRKPHNDKEDNERSNSCRFFKERLNPCRFVKDKIPGIFKASFHLEYLLFFLPAILGWLLAACKIY